jgi:predicted Co/Zn/Cd cation transporter (cation efflux family)
VLRIDGLIHYNFLLISRLIDYGLVDLIHALSEADQTFLHLVHLILIDSGIVLLVVSLEGLLDGGRRLATQGALSLGACRNAWCRAHFILTIGGIFSSKKF